MEAWIWISCAAALAQTIRFMLQKHMAGAGLSASGATFARFVYSAPLIAAGTLIYARVSGQVPDMPTGAFWGYAALGGFMQILATVAVVRLFAMRNFVVGVTLMKTEVLQAAVIGLVLLGDRLSAPVILAILIGMAGVLFMSEGSATGLRRLTRGLDRTAMLGLASGAMFGVSAVCYRGATLSVESGDAALRAGLTLACVTAMQTLAMVLWFGFRDRGQIGKVMRSWRKSGLIGLTSMLGSYGWFTAFSLQQAALVKAVAQVELVFSIIASVVFLGERITPREWAGMALIGTSIMAIILVL